VDYTTPLYPQKLALIRRQVAVARFGIVHSRTQTTKFVLLLLLLLLFNSTPNGVLPGDNGTVRHNRQKYTSHTK
jgi:hypothetical protein